MPNDGYVWKLYFPVITNRPADFEYKILYLTQCNIYSYHFTKFLFQCLFGSVSFYLANLFLLFSTADAKSMKELKQYDTDFKIPVLE